MQVDIDVDPTANGCMSNKGQAVLGHVAEPLSKLRAGHGHVVFYGHGQARLRTAAWAGASV